MRLNLLMVFLFLGHWSAAVEIKDTVYLKRPHFVINTATATYLYDIRGGGFSAIIDQEGRDWIGFKTAEEDKYPESAATSFRGLPNFVFRSEEGGVGHPGFNKCKSFKIGNDIIKTESRTGKWQWLWVFKETHALVYLSKVAPDHPYWFLYEGTIAGRFDPKNQYWGTNTQGRQQKKPDHQQEQLYDHWKWAFFGDNEAKKVFYVAMEKNDKHLDTFSFLGASDRGLQSDDGMVVFGFGRDKDATPLMNRSGEKFYIGFFDKKVKNKGRFKKLKEHINRILDQN
ncbi:MAG: hypothetical protein ACNS62_04020 [Candidatus Cyclobacteriaceae bacterium M3_2C_046]